MKKLLIILSITIVCSSCLRLDDLLFSPEIVTEYKLNNISEDDLYIPKSMLLDNSMIHLFTLNSKNNSGGNETIYACYLGDTSRIKSDTVILYCHGNSTNIDHYWQRASLLANLGSKNRYGVLIFDYQGYGKSTGKSSEQALYNDREVCTQWLKSQGLTNSRFIVYGYSLGSAPATRSCSQPSILIPQKLILEAPFASAATMVSDATPLDLPKTYITNLSINNGDEIQKVSQDLLWLHGIDDSFLNIKAHGQVVYDRHQGVYKEGHKVSGAEHNNVVQTLGYDAYLKIVHPFILR
jgi:alpha/beta superfamily hydrolase